MTEKFRKSLLTLGAIVIIGGGFAAWIIRGNPSSEKFSQFEGVNPRIVDPQWEKIPSVGIATPIGWAAGESPVVAAGLKVSRFAEGLDHPRTMLSLPNGDILVVETGAPPANDPGGVTGFFQRHLMRFAGAGGESPNRLVLLRDTDGTAKAAQHFVLRHDGLASPSGMAYANGRLYVANHDAVLMFDYALGATQITGNPTKIMDLPPKGNHWMRNLLLSPNGKLLYVAVGSASNIGERGMDAEKGRAAIFEIDLATKSSRQFAGGIRNANGLDWNPSTGEMWTTVNERDQVGPDLVPDYLSNVPVGAHYGWPWVYWKNIVDRRVEAPMPEFLTDYTRKPEYALGPHVAALGLAFARGGEKMGSNFANGAFIARHGSWNRKPPSGYDVVFVQFDKNGNPKGQPVPVLTGFLTGTGKTHGRPTWVAWAKDGALLVSDDTAGIIWRVIAPNAVASPTIHPVIAEKMPPQREINSDMEQRYGAIFKKDSKVKQ
ncbi:MAG: hypothetical protein RLY97_1555 [Pseudomonadota bacterium]